MEVHHLEPDELEYELKLRKLRTSQRSQSMSPLRSLIIRESKGEIPKPTGIPPIGDLTAERHICMDKAVKLGKLTNIALAEKNQDDLRWLKSRLIHFLNRISLLAKADPTVREEMAEVEIPLKEKLAKVLEELTVSSGAGAALPPPRRLGAVQEFNEEGGTPVTATQTVAVVESEPLTSALASTTRDNLTGVIYVTSPSRAPVGSAGYGPTTSSSGEFSLPSVSTRTTGAIPKTSRLSAPKTRTSTGVERYEFPSTSELPTRDVTTRGAELRENVHQTLSASIKDLNLNASVNPPPPYSTPAAVASYRSENRPFVPREHEATYRILPTVSNSDAWERRNFEYREPVFENGNHPIPFSDSREVYSQYPLAPPGYQLPTQQPHNQMRQISPADQNLTPRRNGGNPVSTWQIKFDGTSRDLTVDDFLFRVETLARADGVPQNLLVHAIHQLLTGRASTWYWQFCRKVPRATWYQLSYSLRREFEDQTSDYEIKRLIESRKQRPRERFGDFRLELEGLALRLREPMNPSDLLDIMKRNMHPALRKVLILRDFNNIDELDGLCRQIEKLWSEVGRQPRIN